MVPPSTTPVGAIVGGSVAGAVAITAIIATAWYLVKRSHAPSNSQMPFDEPPRSPIPVWLPPEKPGFDVPLNSESAATQSRGRTYMDSTYQNDNTIPISGRISEQ